MSGLTDRLGSRFGSDMEGADDWRGEGRGRFPRALADNFFTPFSEEALALRPLWWVRRCCSMLSLRVKALLHSGQYASFLPVCFFAWRAAWPEVVK